MSFLNLQVSRLSKIGGDSLKDNTFKVMARFVFCYMQLNQFCQFHNFCNVTLNSSLTVDSLHIYSLILHNSIT